MKAAEAKEILDKVLNESYGRLPERIKICAGMGQAYLWTDFPLTEKQAVEIRTLGYNVEWNETVKQHKISW